MILEIIKIKFYLAKKKYLYIEEILLFISFLFYLKDNEKLVKKNSRELLKYIFHHLFYF
jgi:hypothetical protein